MCSVLNSGTASCPASVVFGCTDFSMKAEAWYWSDTQIERSSRWFTDMVHWWEQLLMDIAHFFTLSFWNLTDLESQPLSYYISREEDRFYIYTKSWNICFNHYSQPSIDVWQYTFHNNTFQSCTLLILTHERVAGSTFDGLQNSWLSHLITA